MLLYNCSFLDCVNDLLIRSTVGANYVLLRAHQANGKLAHSAVRNEHAFQTYKNLQLDEVAE